MSLTASLAFSSMSLARSSKSSTRSLVSSTMSSRKRVRVLLRRLLPMTSSFWAAAGSAGVGVLLAVDGVLDGVLGVGLDVLSPVEEVVGQVLGVVDDVGDEPGEGVLALGHFGAPSTRGRLVRTGLIYAMRNITHRVRRVKGRTQKIRPPAREVVRRVACGDGGPSRLRPGQRRGRPGATGG